MRFDKSKSKAFRASEAWKSTDADFVFDETLGQKRLHSFSGNERNCLFLNRGGKQFTDISQICGADNIADGRTFVYWDYDRDGWQDIALVNANAPLLSFYRNSIGEMTEAGGQAGHIIALRLVGGNRAATSSSVVSNRDGFGAKVEVDLGGMKLRREHRCGEGFCAQNSATMIIGIGDHDTARSVKVRWPSGKSNTIENVPHGTLLTSFENLEESTDGSGFNSALYPASARTASQTTQIKVSSPRLTLSLPTEPSSSPNVLRVYTTMATWCVACKHHLPQIETLRSTFDNSEMEIYGVPVDSEDTATKLKTYESTFKPAYKLLANLTSEQRSVVQAQLTEELGSEVLPSTIITDKKGHILRSLKGIPTVSDIRKLARDQ